MSDANLEVLSNLTNEPLERELPDQKLGRLLVPPDLTEGDGTRAETMGLLHTTSGSLWQAEKNDIEHHDARLTETKTYGCGGLPSSLGCELFTRCLA